MVQDSMVIAQGSKFLNLGTKILKIKVQDFFSWVLETTQKWESTGAVGADEFGEQFLGYI